MVTSSVSGCHGAGRRSSVNRSSGGSESTVEVDDVIGHRPDTANAPHYSQLTYLPTDLLTYTLIRCATY